MSNKVKWSVWVIGGIVLILSVMLIILGTIRGNMRTYGLYYASQYYGKGNQYQMLYEDFKTNKNPKEVRNRKDEFRLREPEQNKAIYLYDSEKNEQNDGFSIDFFDDEMQVGRSKLPEYDIAYTLNSKDVLVYSINMDRDDNAKPKHYKQIHAKDTKEFRQKVNNYLEVQLDAIGKPKLNLQRVYDWTQK